MFTLPFVLHTYLCISTLRKTALYDSITLMEPAEGTISDTKTKPLKRIFWGVLLIFLLVIGGYALYHVFTNTAPAPQSYTSLREEAGGTVYFTAQGRDVNVVPSLLSMSVAVGELFQFTPTELASAFTEHLSPDKSMSVYASSPVLTSLDGWYLGTSSQIVTYDVQNETERVLTDTPTYKSNPEWSSDGKTIAYMATDYESAVEESADVETWKIYTVDTRTGAESYITDGAYPQWFPDNTHVLVLRNDGLHIYNTKTQTGVNISEAPLHTGTAQTNMKIDLSRDGSKIAWTLPDEGRALLITLTTPENPSAVVQKEISAHAFWPVLSENSRHLILHEVDWDTLETDPNPRLVLYDLETDEQEKILDFPGIRPGSIAVTDWRN